jgi:hypothetical protein
VRGEDRVGQRDRRKEEEGVYAEVTESTEKRKAKALTQR